MSGHIVWAGNSKCYMGSLQARVNAVGTMMIEVNLSHTSVVKNHFSEQEPTIYTEDSERKSKNRRAEILFCR